MIKVKRSVQEPLNNDQVFGLAGHFRKFKIHPVFWSVFFLKIYNNGHSSIHLLRI
jgi:hypothetical protein